MEQARARIPRGAQAPRGTPVVPRQARPALGGRDGHCGVAACTRQSRTHDTAGTSTPLGHYSAHSEVYLQTYRTSNILKLSKKLKLSMKLKLNMNVKLKLNNKTET